MSETTVAPAKRWAEIHLEASQYVNTDIEKPIYTASVQQIELLLIKFAQAHVKAALTAAYTSVDNSIIPNCDDHTPYYGPCASCGSYSNPQVLPKSDVVLELIKKAYPVENIK
jgi:hypothetical protein